MTRKKAVQITIPPDQLEAMIRREAATLARLDVTQPVILTDEQVHVINNPSTSYWLKAAIFRLCKDRDPVDAIGDATALYGLMSNWYELFNQHGKPDTVTALRDDLEAVLTAIRRGDNEGAISSLSGILAR